MCWYGGYQQRYDAAPPERHSLYTAWTALTREHIAAALQIAADVVLCVRSTAVLLLRVCMMRVVRSLRVRFNFARSEDRGMRR